MNSISTDQQIEWMHAALEQARFARANSEVPVGAVLIRDGQVIASGANRPINACDPTAHAEIVALRKAATHRGNYRLPGSILVVTLEPCAMCLGALMHARVGHLIFGAHDPKTGACGGAFDLTQLALPHRIEVTGGVLADECGGLLREFFSERRRAAE